MGEAVTGAVTNLLGAAFFAFLLDFLSIPKYTGSISRDLHLLRTGVLLTAIVILPP